MCIRDRDDTIGTYNGYVIPDKETAISVAVQIFSGMEKGKTAEKFLPQSVFYDEEDEIWIVLFTEPIKKYGVATLGNGCCIAMQKSDGKVLRIWFEE